MRSLTNSFKSQLEAASTHPILFYEGVFGLNTYRFCSALGDILWNGNTWNGNGYLSGIGVTNESYEEGANGISVTLIGEPEILISLIFNNLKNGQSGKFYFGFMDSNRNIIDPHLLFSGGLDNAEIIDNGTSSTITLSYESELIKLQRSSNLRYNQRTQQLKYPTDIGFEFMEKLTDWSGYWGKVQKKEVKKKRKGGK